MSQKGQAIEGLGWAIKCRVETLVIFSFAVRSHVDESLVPLSSLRLSMASSAGRLFDSTNGVFNRKETLDVIRLISIRDFLLVRSLFHVSNINPALVS